MKSAKGSHKWRDQLPRRLVTPVDGERQAAAAEYFEASEGLYRWIVRAVESGEEVPADAPSPGRLALDAIATALNARLQPPDWAAAVFVHAMRRFDAYEVASLGDAFAVPDWKHRQAKRDELLMAAVSGVVDELQAAGASLKGKRGSKGALELAGERFHMSAKKVEALRTAWFRLCRETGSDPKERLSLADPNVVVDEAWRRGWRVPEGAQAARPELILKKPAKE